MPAAVLSAPAASEQRAAPQIPTSAQVTFGADQVSFDARSRSLDAAGHVHVDEPPFHLTSRALRLKRVPFGMKLEGRGRVAFCPCLGTPLAVRFQGATIAPPHDVVLRSPVLDVFGVPVAWAPLIWLRSPGRAGLLAPDVQWRGHDGLFLGDGVHLPWRAGDLLHGLDLRAGGYVKGGADVDASLRTPATDTRIRWDDLQGQSGVGIQATGATAIVRRADDALARAPDVSWSVDALRGARAVAAVTGVEQAAQPFDRAEASAAWRTQGWTFASGERLAAVRGGDLASIGAAGPVLDLHRGGVLADVGDYDATLEGGALSGPTLGTTEFARANAGALLATRLGPLGASLDARGEGDWADDGRRRGVDAAAQARASLTLPLARAFPSADAGDPWVHETAPRADVAVLASRSSGALILPPAGGSGLAEGMAWVTTAGWHNALGRAGSRTAGELDVSGGAVGDRRSPRPALRARAAVGSEWLGLGADLARVFGASEGAGGAAMASARLGPQAGPRLAAHLAERDGVDPATARGLVDAPLEPPTGFLNATGWTGGSRLVVPVGSRITASGGADVDLSARELVEALGSLEVHDPCNCVLVRATASHRIGRGGVDVWLTVDLPSAR